jgi:chaperonin GroES
MEYDMEDAEGVDSNEPSSELLSNLDEGNLVSKIENNSESYNVIMEEYGTACSSMKEWIKKYNNAINLSKLQPTAGGKEIESKTFPFAGASLAMMPYILEAALDFNSRAAPELVWNDEIVTTKIYGRDISRDKLDEQDQLELDKTNKDKKSERASRVSTYMNYQLNEKIQGWREDQDKALMMLPIVGTFYKKTFWDYDTKGICSELVRADRVIFNMECDSFDAADHKFQKITISRNDLISFIRGEQKWDIEESELDADDCKDGDEFEFIEAYTYIDLDDDGLKEPYIAVLDEVRGRIVCLYPNYDEDTLHFNDDGEVVKVEPDPVFTQYRFLPDPEGGPMGMGWGILLGPMFSAINTNVRQLLDAGTVSLTAANSGLVASGIGSGRGGRQETGPIEVKMAQLTPVNMGSMGGSLRDNIVQFPFAGPSPVLMQLVEYLVNSARTMTNAAVNVEANQGEAASLYLARLQQGLKVPNSIIMRVFDCAKNEFKKIHSLDYRYHDSEAYNRVLDEDREYVMEDDFNPKDCDIRLAGNPSQGSDIERVARAEANLQMGMQQAAAGQNILNLRQLTINWLEATKTEGIEELTPEPQGGPSPEAQAVLAEKQMEAELKQKDQVLRENQQRLQEQKLAMQAAKEMTALGLDADKMEADITKKYMESLKIAYEIGLNGVEAVQQVERTFIDAEGGINEAPQPSNSNPGGPMAERAGNPSPAPISPAIR